MADSKLDMSLDELIKKTGKKKPQPHKGAGGAGAKRAPLKMAGKAGRGGAAGKQQQQRGGGRPQVVTVNLSSVRRGGIQKPGRGGGRGTLPFSQQRTAQPYRPDARPPPAGQKWGHDMYAATQFNAYEAPVVPTRPAAPTTTKLFISNLHYNVTEDDIRELFQACGVLKEHRIHFDSSGRSLGTAHVVYERATEAEMALRKYNNVALDGSKMKIELVESPPPPPGTIATLASGINVQVLSETGGYSRGRGRGGFARGGGAGRGPRGRGFVASEDDYMQE